MADGFKEFPPSELKLSRLRSAGVVPIGRDLLTFSILLALPITVGLLISIADDSIFEWAKKMFAERIPEGKLLEQFMVGARLFLKITLSAVGAILVAVLIVGSVQNRFLFTMTPLGFSFGRLFAFDGSYLRELVPRFLGSLVRAMLVLLLFVTGFLIVRQFVFQLDPEPIQLDKPNVSVEQLKLAAAEASSHLGRVCGIFAVVALLIGILSRLLVVALFKRRHRMTRAEMEAELREMEAAPQFSGARQNLLD